ncbi:MAG: chloride channel protein [Eubacterium sp.]|nr:chloride channel protein [Eubacterium sp.]
MKQEQRYTQTEYVRRYVRLIIRWSLLSIIIGAVCGIVGALFYNGVLYATSFRKEHQWLLFLLPLAGIAIVYMYKKLGLEGKGTDDIIDSVHESAPIKIRLVPAIFAATMLTHLFGGSAGKEGAALQLGGGIGNYIGRRVNLHSEDLRIATMAGMAAFFAAIFGTPLTATVFVVMFIKVGHLYQMAVFPCFLSSYTANWVAGNLGVVSFGFHITIPTTTPYLMLKILILAALCGLVSTLMCNSYRFIHSLYDEIFSNSYFKIISGGLIIILLSLLVGKDTYNGAGSETIALALSGGNEGYFAFLLKILFTALTLGAGFKGGEIVPTLFIGTSFGCVIAPLLGIPSSFGAALCMVALFGGATNTMLAPVCLAIECFGGGGIQMFALASFVGYLCSGYNGLYSSQKILYSKLQSRQIEIRTNRNHMVKRHEPEAISRLVSQKSKRTYRKMVGIAKRKKNIKRRK